jgi:DeoR/GlpR family transcriptional regulator of sugar metabolism
MNSTKRRMEIYQLLQQQESVEVSVLAEQFKVSAMTVRRDLELFQKQGLVTTSYGGAYLNRSAGIQPSFTLKQGHMADAKEQIAKTAAALIKDGDSIIIDCGTSTVAILKFIHKKKVTVITGAWSAVGYLHGNPKITLILTPGEYDELSAGTVSATTAEFVRNFHADLAFISTQGLDSDYGATVPTAVDAMVKRTLLEAGEKKVLLVDSSKIGRRYFARHAKTEEFNIIITDKAVSEEQAEEIRKHCGELVITGPEENAAAG